MLSGENKPERNPSNIACAARNYRSTSQLCEKGGTHRFMENLQQFDAFFFGRETTSTLGDEI
jgi:hypothetical protein